MAELRVYEYVLNGVKTTGQLTEAHATALGATPLDGPNSSAAEAPRRRARAPRNKARDEQ